MDESHSYTKSKHPNFVNEFNTFKKNHKGDAFGDIVEGESTDASGRGKNMVGFLRTIPHKAGRSATMPL